jgi:biopolymer transport protein ExbD
VRFQKHQGGSQMPEVNLVPMMDVVMTILTFFIIVSMTLTGQQSVDIALPSANAGVNREQPEVQPLIVGLNDQGALLVNNTPASEAQMAQQVVDYLNANAKGTVALKASKQLPYEKVVKVLGTLRDVGGDRVSLAIES